MDKRLFKVETGVTEDIRVRMQFLVVDTSIVVSDGKLLLAIVYQGLYASDRLPQALERKLEQSWLKTIPRRRRSEDSKFRVSLHMVRSPSRWAK